MNTKTDHTKSAGGFRGNPTPIFRIPQNFSICCLPDLTFLFSEISYNHIRCISEEQRGMDLANKSQLIADSLLEKIRSKQLSGRIPSDKKIAEEYHVALMTAVRASAAYPQC